MTNPASSSWPSTEPRGAGSPPPSSGARSAARRRPARRRSPATPPPRGPRGSSDGEPPTIAASASSVLVALERPARLEPHDPGHDRRRPGGRARRCARRPPRRRRGPRPPAPGTSVSRSVTANSALTVDVLAAASSSLLETGVLARGLRRRCPRRCRSGSRRLSTTALVDVGRAHHHADRDREEDGRDRHDVEPERDHAAPRRDTVRTGP